MYALPNGQARTRRWVPLLGKLLRSQKTDIAALGNYDTCVVQARHSRILSSGKHISDTKLAIVKSELLEPSDRKTAVRVEIAFLPLLAPRQGPD